MTLGLVAGKGGTDLNAQHNAEALAAINAAIAQQNAAEAAAGVIPTATINIATIAADADTLTIGTDIYEFLDGVGGGAGAQISNDAYIGVSKGANVAATRANFIAAVNGVGTGVADGCLVNGGGSPVAIEDGTESVLAAADGGDGVTIKPAASRGGTAAASSPSIVLAEGLTQALDIWDVGNVNMNTLAGAAPAVRVESKAVLTVNAGIAARMAVGAGEIYPISFTFAVAGFTYEVIRTGVSVKTAGVMDDLFSISGNDVLITSAAANNLLAADVVYITAWS